MKYFFTSMLLILLSFAKGQIVNIPDSNFKRFLINATQPEIDVNHDGEIQLSEALSVTAIEISGTQAAITDITGIQSFSNLTSLWIACDITSLDISGLNNLVTLTAWGNELSNPTITSININNSPKLQVVNLSIKTDTLNPIGLDSLKSIGLDYSNIKYLNLTNCINLEAAGIGNGKFQRVDLSNLQKIQVLGITSIDSLTQLKLNVCAGLKALDVNCSTLNDLDVSGCINLEHLSLVSSQIKTLDLSQCYKLATFYLLTPGLEKLNIKNGLESRLDRFLISAENSIDICADEFEINTLHSYFAMQQINISPYCSFFPGGNYNTITGKTMLSSGSSNCDSTNRVLANVMVKITDTSGYSLTRTTGTSGLFAHYPYKGLFTLTPYFPYPYFSVTPAVTTVAFDTANSITETRNFCIVPNGIHNDLEITFLPTFPPARPGFDAAYTLVYKNRGTTTLSGNVAVNFDNSKMNFVSASENVTTQSSGQLLWNYNNLQPFESRTINVTFNLLPPPVNNIGDTISYLAVITPSNNDETAFDNIFILPQRVIGSFDPNDKQCIEGSNLDISNIGDYLHYQIRFQNEGTDTAFNVVVADTLSDKLDWNSYEFIGSSHAADVKLSNNKLEFFFQDINLPYKTIDEPGSNGWVAFKIKPKPSVVIGDSLNNRAAIYFDFNLPVITNTATTIVTSSSVPVPVKLEYFAVNKKDNTNVLNWKADCSYGNATFIIERSNDGIYFSSIGNINATAVRCQLPFNFTDNNPASGKNYYRLKITDADGKTFYSKTLMTGNSKAGISITAIANNTIYLNSNKQQTVIIKVIAAEGREIVHQQQTIAAGNNNISLAIKSAAAGVYTLIMYTNEGEIITRRFVQ